MDSAVYTLGTRIFSNALPTHLPAHFSTECSESGFRIAVTPGHGSCPSLTAELGFAQDRDLPPSFKSSFASWNDAVQFLACQDAALTKVETSDCVAVAEISLPVDIPAIRPLFLRPHSLDCPFLRSLNPANDALCFLLPEVKFRAISETLLSCSNVTALPQSTDPQRRTFQRAQQ